ncbi:MAG: hypothetical protein J5797_09200 [Prevotella sp.]|nr:hypothetical protein [Prevotella sp.]
MEKTHALKDIAPFSSSDLVQTVKELRKYRSLMWNQAQNDGKLGYAMQYYEVVRTLIYGIYFTWEKYKYENGWIDGIAEEGEDMMQYQMFQIGVVERIEGLLQACRQENVFGMFPGGKETNEKLILIYGDLLSNLRKGAIRLDNYNLQSL